MNSKSLVSIDDISRDEILQLLESARHFEENPNRRLLEGKDCGHTVFRTIHTYTTEL